MTMPAQGRPLRGTADLRTLTNRSDIQIPAHKAYLRISFLELEKARRTLEVRAASDRFEKIQTRFREIDAEIANILANLNGAAPRAHAVAAPHRSPVGRKPMKRNFQLSY
ncbi:hypothetical protein [Methylocella tundrae]|jgi:hypothetical protein|uniref:hypothetical protein n=1 Tax=Methylocella tundrae TaxID=227605 RepID=UPI00106B2BF8|nr:hypothetical protein [Methylocella tundrae]WPP03081.1 hypothetical protein SIN04_01600 [Methylocella tundrae]